MPSSVVSMNPEGLLEPGAKSRATSPATKPMMTIQRMFTTGAWRGLYPPRRLLLIRDTTLWSHFIHGLRQLLRQMGQQLIARHSGLPRERIQGVGADCLFQFAWRDCLIRAIADPRLRDMALPGLLKLFDELTDSAAE